MIEIVNAINIHDKLFEIFNEGFEASVHSVFNNVINIIDDKKNIYSILTETNEKFPFSIIIKQNRFENISVFEKVYIKNKILFIGSLKIDLSNVKTYSIEKTIFKFNRESIIKKVKLSKNLISNLKKESEYKSNLLKEKADEMLFERLSNIKQSFLFGSEAEILKNLRSIVGLGVGLTPTGDDYLTSIITFVVMDKSPFGNFNKCLVELLEFAKEQTNILSYSYLERAYKGFTRGKLLDFINSFFNYDDTEKLLIQLATVGSTSGLDLAEGVIFSLEIILKMEEDYGY